MKGDISRAARWFTINGAMAAGLSYGLIERVPGALNLGLFLLWAQIAFALLLGAVRQAGEAFRMERRSVPNWIAEPLRLGVLMLLAWYGQWIAVGGWAVACALFTLYTMPHPRDRNIVDI